MRERIAQLENKFAELLEFGEENDAIGDKVHRFCVSLLEAEDFESIRQAIYTHLQEDFAVPHVAFRVWNSVLSRSGPSSCRWARKSATSPATWSSPTAAPRRARGQQLVRPGRPADPLGGPGAPAP
jgi:uncharacterized protein YigA (DUF484 family)